MSRRSRIITSILTVLFALTAASALTAFAENNEEGGGSGGGQSGYSEDQGNQGGNEGGSGNEGGNEGGSGNEGGNEGGSGSDYQPPRDYGNDNDNGNSYDNDNDDSYSNRNSYNNYDNDDSGESYYDMDGNRYSNSSDIYVGGDQTYTPPATVPETTAALYDISSTKVDSQTLTNSDWKDIQAKLTEASNTSKTKDVDTGDFAFIQKNTEVEDNGHWMLILGFALIILSVIGFVILIANAGERKRAPAYRGARATAKTAPRYRTDAPPTPAAPTEAEAEPEAEAVAAPAADLGMDPETDFDADPEVEEDKPDITDRAIEKPKKKSKKGTRYRKD